MRTIKQVLDRLGACPRAKKKYSTYGRAFKRAFMDASWQDAQWIGYKIFSSKYPLYKVASTRSYKDLPVVPWESELVDADEVGVLFRKKANRLKYWPTIRRRLIEVGVQL